MKDGSRTDIPRDMPKAGPCGVVIFGASGNLAHRKLFPSFFSLYKSGSLPAGFFLAGAGRTRMSDGEFRVSAGKAVMEAGLKPDEEELNGFCSMFYYFPVEYGDKGSYAGLGAELEKLAQKHGTGGNAVFMLAVPPEQHARVIEGLGAAGIIKKQVLPFSRVMVEKPFGRDTDSAAALNSLLLRYVDEGQIFRVDHYLGKNTVQNIIVFRFANLVFLPAWKSEYIDSVQIIFSEESGMEGRGGYFDRAGLIRDVLQNHLLQLLTLVAMEKPEGLAAGAMQDKKVKVLRSIVPPDPGNLGGTMIRGQYSAGTAGGKNLPAYREEKGVAPDSCVETFFAAKLFVDNETWKSVPFYIKAGKRLDRTAVSIHVIFRDEPGCLLCKEGIGHKANMLTFEIQPDQGVNLRFNARVPGSKMRVKPLDMEFNYGKIFGPAAGGDYENIILDCMTGDQTLFWRKDAIEESWKLLTPVLDRWESCSFDEKSRAMFYYLAGSRGPKEADEFIRRDGREWMG